MDRLIRIIQVIGALNCGGTENMIMNIYRHIDRNKIQFDFIKHTREANYFDEEIKSLGGRIFSCPQYKGTNHISYKKWWEKFFKEHKEYEIIHSHVRSTATIILKIAKKYGLRTIAHSHSTSNGVGLKSIYKKILQKNIIKYADYCFACSVDSGKWLYGKDIVNKKNFKMIPNAIDTSKYLFTQEVRQQTRQQLGILENEFVIGHIGRFAKMKNHTFLINIFREVLKQNEKSKLLLVGDGELRKDIEEKAKTLGVFDKIIFTGVTSDVPELLMAMDCFVFPSIYEGLGIVLIEAQTSGLQCFASDAVPKEAKLTELVKFISLNENAYNWANNILINDYSQQRLSKIEEIKNANYDIKDTANWLEKFYIERLIND